MNQGVKFAARSFLILPSRAVFAERKLGFETYFTFFIQSFSFYPTEMLKLICDARALLACRFFVISG
jgi:hypothetical protein